MFCFVFLLSSFAKRSHWTGCFEFAVGCVCFDCKDVRAKGGNNKKQKKALKMCKLQKHGFHPFLQCVELASGVGGALAPPFLSSFNRPCQSCLMPNPPPPFHFSPYTRKRRRRRRRRWGEKKAPGRAHLSFDQLISYSIWPPHGLMAKPEPSDEPYIFPFSFLTFFFFFF